MGFSARILCSIGFLTLGFVTSAPQSKRLCNGYEGICVRTSHDWTFNGLYNCRTCVLQEGDTCDKENDVCQGKTVCIEASANAKSCQPGCSHKSKVICSQKGTKRVWLRDQAKDCWTCELALREKCDDVNNRCQGGTKCLPAPNGVGKECRRPSATHYGRRRQYGMPVHEDPSAGHPDGARPCSDTTGLICKDLPAESWVEDKSRSCMTCKLHQNNMCDDQNNQCVGNFRCVPVSLSHMECH